MKKILLWSMVVFVLIQLIPIDRTNKPVDKKQNFVDVMQSPKEIQEILKNACYDCHSNEVKYPKYAYIAPFSWSIKHHVNEGRERVYFSVWTSYNAEQKAHILDEITETVETKEMPLKGYIPMHPEADLTDAQRKAFNDYFKSIQKLGKY
jgi:hypothetical protein